MPRPLTSRALDAAHEQLVQLLELRRDGEVDELVANLRAAAVREHSVESCAGVVCCAPAGGDGGRVAQRTSTVMPLMSPGSIFV